MIEKDKIKEMMIRIKTMAIDNKKEDLNSLNLIKEDRKMVETNHKVAGKMKRMII